MTSQATGKKSLRGRAATLTLNERDSQGGEQVRDERTQYGFAEGSIDGMGGD